MSSTPALLDAQTGSLAESGSDIATLGPSWFGPTREAAMTRFKELGLPASNHDDWRFTNIAPIRDTDFVAANGHAAVTAGDVEAVNIPGLEGTRLVFVNGRFNAGLSKTEALPAGVKVLSLAEAFDTERALLEEHLGKLAPFDEQAFTALNTALAEDGVVVVVPRGGAVGQPIHVLNITAAIDRPILTNPRNLIIAGEGAAVTVVEDYVSLRGDTYLTNAVTEIFVGDNAEVTHYLLERESRSAFNVSSLHIRQGRDSRFSSHSVLLGGAIVRNNINPVLDGDHCDSLLNGLYVIGGTQTVDNHMRVVHAKTHGDSRQFYKGIMNDQARGVFRGRIVVRPDAQKTDAKQSNQNLLLSPNATANADPQLEIFADDVKCTHGATIGQINEDQVFYLRSRGIPMETARAIIIYAFASESLERMPLEPIRRFLQSELLQRLPAGKVLESSM